MQDRNIPDQQPPDPSTLPTGSQLFRDWLEHEGSKSWDALDTSPDGNYEKVWQAWLMHLSGQVAIVDKKRPARRPRSSKSWHQATELDVQSFLQIRDGQRAHHHPERKISPVTRRRYWRLLERIYDHAMEHGWISANPATGLEPAERPPSEDGKGHCLPPLLWQSLPRHFPSADGYQDARDRAIVLLLYELALAPEEVRCLLWKNLLSNANQVWVGSSESIANGESPLPRYLQIEGGRNAQQRLLELPDSVAQALQSWRRFSAAQRGPSVIDGNHIVFYSRRGGELSVRMLFHVASQIIQRAHNAQPEDSQKFPLQRVGPQVLRNTAIVQWLRAGVPESEVIARIGVDSTRSLRHLQHYL
ncbi:site-specific integrase [Comamonas sp. AG1104]|uniref:tyrosine-type recombinase/integrase n=1 Tax=Comamonas sp. AG1104 TaxID=2183900 RepID=UPI000E0B5A2C|nr:site-specific integrase [Comamonas sp. AG1104]RDI15382.1 site-specific recombinase XerD [Comamonas sp. AG1104]